MRLIHPITLLLLASCHNQVEEGTNSLSGQIKDGKFSNDYLTIDILQDWIELPGEDSTQFLVINKPKKIFNPNIILLALNRKGFYTAEDYMKSLTEHFSAKPEYELVSQMEVHKIDGRIFFFSEFTMMKDNKKIRQLYGAANMRDYFLGIVTTDDPENIEPEIWTILESIEFKDAVKKREQRASITNAWSN